MHYCLIPPKEDFRLALQQRIKKGQDILTAFDGTGSGHQMSFVALEKEFRLWNSYNQTWLEQAFGNSPQGCAEAYGFAGSDEVEKIDLISQGWSSAEPRFRFHFFAGDLSPKLEYLESLHEQLDLIPQANASSPPATALPLINLHPTIQQAAGSLYATGHYRQALLDAYIAVDNAVRDKAQLTGSGTRLMETAFSPGNPVLKIGDSQDEQQGFLSLFRGAMLAIRNPKAHSLNGTHDAQRALEWLSFASVLLRNLDEAILQLPNDPTT